MQVEDGLEGQLMIAAFNKKQQIEASKVAAIVTAMVNPEKAHDAYRRYLRLLMPDFDEVQSRMDDKRMKNFEEEKQKIFVLSPTHSGWAATESKVSKE